MSNIPPRRPTEDPDAQEQRRMLAELERARRAAETASRVKSNLLRVMSHELKTPITAMQLNVRVLEEDPDLRHFPRMREGLERIARSSRRLTHLVDAALYWARAESGRCSPVITTFPLGAVVNDVRAEIADYASQKGIGLTATLAAAPPIATDRKIARLVVYLLVERAVQVTESGSVHVTVDWQDGCHHVSVRDGAPRIDRDEEARLFDPLSRDDLLQATGAGSGLGLYVVKDLVRALRGDLALVPGAANVFRLQLRSLSADDVPHSWRGTAEIDGRALPSEPRE